MSGNLNILGTINALPQGTVSISPPTIIPNGQNLFGETNVNLASGANTINVPTWAAGAIITPPATNTVALTLKGISGDTGIAIGNTAPMMLSFPASPPTSFVISAASLTTGLTTITFF